MVVCGVLLGRGLVSLTTTEGPSMLFFAPPQSNYAAIEAVDPVQRRADLPRLRDSVQFSGPETPLPAVRARLLQPVQRPAEHDPGRVGRGDPLLAGQHHVVGQKREVGDEAALRGVLLPNHLDLPGGAPDDGPHAPHRIVVHRHGGLGQIAPGVDRVEEHGGPTDGPPPRRQAAGHSERVQHHHRGPARADA